MTYLNQGQKFTCHLCGKKEIGNIYCNKDHYICDTCHGHSTFELVQKDLLNNHLTDPLQIAEKLMLLPQIPMLGCENAWIAAGALMTAIRNEGTLQITNEQIIEVLNRTHRQAIGGYCGLTGACGVPIGIGASFSILLDAACPKDRETSLTMQFLAQTITAVAAETGPCCCKNFVRTSLKVAARILKEHFQVYLPLAQKIDCTYVERHPHGCRKEKCQYYKSSQEE
nr:DUF5714 domain-containing protein [Anoxybacter fermentans]